MAENKLFDLSNRVYIVSGGAGLLGRAFVKACAEHQAKVVVADKDEEKGKKMFKDNPQVVFKKCDIAKQDNVKGLIEMTLSKFDKIDGLINSAYPKNKNYGRKFEDVAFEDFCENIEMHLGGYFLITKQVSKIMMKQQYGNIVNIASIYGFSAPRFEIYQGANMTMPVEYAATEAGIINLTKYFASYLGKYNIRVNAISAGGVFDNQPESFVREYSKKVILGKRMAQADDLTGVLLFLLSDASKYITGQNIVADGGWSL